MVYQVDGLSLLFLNSCCNKVMFEYVLDCQMFYSEYTCCYYGDDTVVNHCGIDWSLFVTLMYKHFGMIVTDGDKQTKFPNHKSLDKVRFIGRRFRFSQGHVFAPLLPEVIDDMVIWVSDVRDKRFLTCEVIRSALFEWAHHPKHVYIQKRKALQVCCRRTALQVPELAFSYEEMVAHLLGN